MASAPLLQAALEAEGGLDPGYVRTLVLQATGHTASSREAWRGEDSLTAGTEQLENLCFCR